MRAALVDLLTEVGVRATSTTYLSARAISVSIPSASQNSTPRVRLDRSASKSRPSMIFPKVGILNNPENIAKRISDRCFPDAVADVLNRTLFCGAGGNQTAQFGIDVVDPPVDAAT